MRLLLLLTLSVSFLLASGQDEEQQLAKLILAAASKTARQFQDEGALEEPAAPEDEELEKRQATQEDLNVLLKLAGQNYEAQRAFDDQLNESLGQEQLMRQEEKDGPAPTPPPRRRGILRRLSNRFKTFFKNI